MQAFLESNDVTFKDGKIKLPENTKHVKLDIGLSYNAPHSGYWLKHEEDLQVFGFEPYPENIKNIRRGEKKRNPAHSKPIESKYIDNGFTLVPCALSNSKETEMSFYVTSRDSGCSSLFQPKEQHVGPLKETIKVKVFRLKQFFDLFPWDNMPIIEYIKIDAQGSDLNILKGAEEYLRERVVYVTCEADGFQYYGADSNNDNEIIKYMKSNGFHYIKHKHTNDPTFINKKFMKHKNVLIFQE